MLLNSFAGELAKKNGVREEWIGRVESCLNGHLAEWGYAPKEQSFAFSIDGHEDESLQDLWK